MYPFIAHTHLILNTHPKPLHFLDPTPFFSPEKMCFFNGAKVVQ
jgi:hypothetical protein